MIFQYGLGDIGYDPGWNSGPVQQYEKKYMWLQTGANALQGLTMNLPDMRTNALGFRGGMPDVTTLAKATEYLGYIDNAVSTVSDERARTGAIQNRLEFTMDCLDNASENLSSAESRIGGADVAKEMMEITEINVLAQSDQSPEMVLRLLRQ